MQTQRSATRNSYTIRSSEKHEIRSTDTRRCCSAPSPAFVQLSRWLPGSGPGRRALLHATRSLERVRAVAALTSQQAYGSFSYGRTRAPPIFGLRSLFADA